MNPVRDATWANPGRTGAILEAALALFGEQGYDSVGMDDIGAVVGVSGPAIYRHFASKAELLAAVVENEGAQLLVAAEEIVAQAPSPRTALELLIRDLTMRVVDDGARLVVTYIQQERGVPKDAKARVVEHHRRYVERLADLLREIRPDLTDEERQLRTEAMLGLLNSSVYFVTEMDATSVAENLVGMAMAVLVDG